MQALAAFRDHLVELLYPGAFLDDLGFESPELREASKYPVELGHAVVQGGNLLLRLLLGLRQRVRPLLMDVRGGVARLSGGLGGVPCVAGILCGSVGFLDQWNHRRRPARRIEFASSFLDLRGAAAEFRQLGLVLHEFNRLYVPIPDSVQPGLSDVTLYASLFELRLRPPYCPLQRFQRRVGNAAILFTQALFQRVEFVFLPGRRLLRCASHPLVHIEPQQRAQHLAASARRICLQKLGEFPLRKNHGLGEGIHIETEQARDFDGRRAQLVGDDRVEVGPVMLLEANGLRSFAASAIGLRSRCP